ncbi:MAG: PEP-CTERM sorting domain-containing protein [Syntrophaceae bacterium]|nr:PEP-CTERM sorting domain-containing protein [Syntrophaceae bacterium]
MMRTYAKLLAVVVVAVFAFAGSPVQAVTVSFDYQVPTDNSGKTSPVGVNNANVALPGYFIETFDKPGSAGETIVLPGGNIYVNAGGGFNSLNPYTDLSIMYGSVGIRKDSVTGVAATPAGDTTFYAYAPGTDYPDGNTAAVRVLYEDFMQTYGVKISYLGLYYGSIDTYNEIAFYSGDSPFIGDGILSDGVITGTELLNVFGGYSGNQFQDGSNMYVNLFFDADELFTAFEFRTSAVAFEMDNVVTGFAAVPEPTTILLLGLGLVGLAGARRKLEK